MKKLLLSSLLAAPLFGAAETLHFASRPVLSPDASQIYFSYEGDIFRVPIDGGTALRLVSIGGNETAPKISPDGKFLAFASDINGNNDVYIVPIEGGDVKRLTWHESNDVPAAWSPDSKSIYFESNRANGWTTYKVNIDGGTPERLFDGYFNTIHNLVENPVSHVYYFNESGESIGFPTRKRYVGEHNADIRMWNPATREYKTLTNHPGKDCWPMTDKEGILYYVSDALNQEANIVKYDPNGGKSTQLTEFDQSVQYPSISYDGSKIVFLLGYKITCLDPNTGNITVPEISIADNSTEMQRSFAGQKPQNVAVSPDGRKFALSIRGLLYVSDSLGKYCKLLETPKDERVDQVVWSDNQTIYYIRTDKGYKNIFRIKADGSEPEKAVYQAPVNVQSLVKSHKGDKIAFISGSNAVMLLDAAKGTTEKIADAEFWSFSSYSLCFSFDDSHLAFEAMSRFENDIYIYDFKNKTLHNLTNSASTEWNPQFAPDGKNLYFVADLFNSSFPRGGGASTLYRLPLQRYDQVPFKSAAYDQLFCERDTTKRQEKRNKELIINYDDIFRRLQPMPENGHSLFTYRSGKKSWLLYSAWNKVKCLEISNPEAQPQEIPELRNGYFTTSDNGLYYVAGGDIYTVNLDPIRTSKVSIAQNVEKSLNDEFRQMFYEAWAVMEQNFYDVNFHGTDWKADRDYYASFLPFVRSRAHLRTLFNDMLGELNSSHQGFYSWGPEEEQPQIHAFSAETGIVWRNDKPFVIDRILTDSPANNVDCDIKSGDELVAVNGKRVDQNMNRESYFLFPSAPDEIKLTLARGGKEFDVKLHVTSYGQVKNMLYTEWEDKCRERVDAQTNGRVGYIHMRDMGGNALQEFLKAMHTDVVNRDALILDLRYNNGGNVHKEVIDFLGQRAHFRWSYRDFPSTTHPNVTPGDKPLVVLVNERSLSDAEVTSNGIQTLDIATIVGTETYRWIIFTSGVSLIDGSSCRMPAWGCYSLTGKDLESTGVKPDIYVKNTFVDRLEGNDPQLDTAIKEVLRQLGE